jgi:molecular chaperone GrpE
MTDEMPQPEASPSPDPLAELHKNLEECQDKYVRLLAESENSRKRMQKEKLEFAKFGVEKVIAEFLHPLDSFEKALKFAEAMSDEVKNWAIGFEMILGQFKQVLNAHGATEYESKGHHFDPHWHEAVEVVETNEFEPGIIIQEFVRGYRIGERAIRVARVKVAKKPGVATENQKEGA